MTGRIPDSFIDGLLARVDIVELIGARVPLKRKGKEYTACCPFHDERTPSFYVSPTKAFYHCFGCGAHGTAIKFLMEYDRLEFVDGVYTDRIRIDEVLGVLSVTAESDTLIDEKQVVIIVRTLDGANNVATTEQRTESLTISTGCVAGSTSLSAPTMNRMVMRKGSNTAMDVIASFQTGNNLCPVTSYELVASDDVADRKSVV